MTGTHERDRYLLVTSDAHAGAAMADYRPYLDPKWHPEFDEWLAGVVMPWVDVRDTSNWDNDVRLAHMDADGVSAEIVFPNTLPPFFDILAHLSGVPRDRFTFERKWAGLQAHNRWLVDFCREAPLRRRGIVQLLPNDIDVAIAELQWAAATGNVAGVMLPAIPANHAVAPYFDARYDPLWDACVEAELPVHQHQGTGSPDVGSDPIATTIFFTELELWTKRTMHHLIVGGVFERHPALQVVWTEMWGLRWVVEELAQMTLRLRNVQIALRRAAPRAELQPDLRFTGRRRAVAHPARVLPAQLFDRRQHAAAPRREVLRCARDRPHHVGHRRARTRKARRRARPTRCAPPCSTSPRPTCAPCSVRPPPRGTASTSTRWRRSRR